MSNNTRIVTLSDIKLVDNLSAEIHVDPKSNNAIKTIRELRSDEISFLVKEKLNLMNTFDKKVFSRKAILLASVVFGSGSKTRTVEYILNKAKNSTDPVSIRRAYIALCILEEDAYTHGDQTLLEMEANLSSLMEELDNFKEFLKKKQL